MMRSLGSGPNGLGYLRMCFKVKKACPASLMLLFFLVLGFPPATCSAGNALPMPQ